MAIKIKKDKPVKKEYTFKEPYTFEGETYETIELDFTGIKGKHLIQMKQGINVTEVNLLMNTEFTAKVAAWAANQPPEFMEEAPAGDYMVLTTLAQNFLADRFSDVEL